MIGDRDFHHTATSTARFAVHNCSGNKQICLQAIRAIGDTLAIALDTGDYQTDKVWYWNYHLPEETRRGLADQEDLYSPAT